MAVVPVTAVRGKDEERDLVVERDAAQRVHREQHARVLADERRLASAEPGAGTDADAVVLARKTDVRDRGISLALLDERAEPLVGQARHQVDAGFLQLLEDHWPRATSSAGTAPRPGRRWYRTR